MAFSSLAFVFLFLPILLAVYFWAAPRLEVRWSKLLLIAASLLFYATAQVADLPLLLGSISVNYLVSRGLGPEARLSPRSRRWLLIAALAGNILFLCAFKYAIFFVGIFHQLTHTAMPVAKSSFPLGISFFTIQQIMYLVDRYQGLIEDQSPLDFILFASFFPYVTMGPIVRWQQIGPQIQDPKARFWNPDNIATGLFIFVVGFFKKVVLADSFYRWADAGFAYPAPLSAAGAWIAALAFTFELYFDFSGYTDMALGAALMLNFKLPQNFDSPFRATSIIDFWRRWHITLTNFITGYLYTPMLRAFRRPTLHQALAATFLAMVIAGFWHGANWTFVVFGGLHGIALAANQFWRQKKLPMFKPLGWLLTFTFVVISMVFFRSANLHQGAQMVASMFGQGSAGVFSYQPWTGIERAGQFTGLTWLLCGIGAIVIGRSSLELQRAFKPSRLTLAACVAMAVVACIYANGVVSRSFVYRAF